MQKADGMKDFIPRTKISKNRGSNLFWVSSKFDFVGDFYENPSNEISQF